jgi:hypothetical protein
VSRIPLADARGLARIGLRTTLVRATLAVLVVAAIALLALHVRDPHRQALVELPEHSNAIVVLDLSASISSETYTRIGATLSQLVDEGGRYGLVVFSDQAYEALPPGSPAADLEPLVRYFTLPTQERPGFLPQFPANPWTRSFSAGTKISAGLALAHEVALEDDLSRPAVVLVSDLDDDPQDIQRLAAVLLAYRRDRIPMKVVALNAAERDRALFTALLRPSAVVVHEPAAAPTRGGRTPFPWALVALALAAAAALAAHELWSPRLEWGRTAA